jgi:hypothetical protein
LATKIRKHKTKRGKSYLLVSKVPTPAIPLCFLSPRLLPFSITKWYSAEKDAIPKISSLGWTMEEEETESEIFFHI